MGWIWLILLGWLVAIPAGAHAMLRKRSPASATMWIFVCLLLPFVGPVFYVLLGINRTTRRARKRMRSGRTAPSRDGNWTTRSDLKPSMQHLAPLVQLGDRILQERLIGGNQVDPLFDGEGAYAEMLKAIHSAKRSITCCMYIFDYDHIGHKFIQAFADAADRGVRVCLLIDAVGGWWYAGKVWRAFRTRKMRPATFAPVGLTPTRLMHFNLRNHRKILVVDGNLGFTGGINISAVHMARDKKNPYRFRDAQFAVRGPMVAHLQNAFADDWFFAKGERLAGNDFFPALEAAGPMVGRGIADGPDDKLRKLQWIFIGACQAADRTLRIMTPYFIPNEAVKSAIVSAALRGVKVTLVVPQWTDVPVSTWATAAYLWEFLEHGVHVYFSGPLIHHTKLTVVDECWTFFGSANIDPRSLRLNFEFNCEVYDESLGAAMAANIDQITAAGVRVTLKMMDERPLSIRLRDSFFKLFSPYL